MSKIAVLDTCVLLASPDLKDYEGKEVYIPIAVFSELDKQKEREGSVGMRARAVNSRIKKSYEDDKYYYYNVLTKETVDRMDENDEKYVKIIKPNSDLESRIDQSKVANETKADDAFLNMLILEGNEYELHTLDFSLFQLLRIANLNTVFVKEIRRSFANHMYSGQRVIFVPDYEFDNPNLIDCSKFDPNEYILVRNASNVKGGRRLMKNKNGRLIQLKEKKVYKVSHKNKEQQMLIDSMMDESINTVIVTGKAGTGKAQPLDAKVLTPEGFVNMGDIKVGDKVIGEDGKPHNVTGVFPQGKKPSYEVVFEDGSKTECCDEHLWTVFGCRKGFRTLTLKEIMEAGVIKKDGSKRFKVPTNKAVEFSEKDYELPIDPYVVGVLIGDGCISHGCVSLGISNSEEDIFEKVANKLNPDGFVIGKENKNNYTRLIMDKRQKTNRLRGILSELGIDCIARHKRIPEAYLYSSTESRMELLKGLMDTDGHVRAKKQGYKFSTSSPDLRDDFIFLCRSLGYRATYRVDAREGYLDCYEVSIRTRDIIVSSEKHMARLLDRKPDGEKVWKRIYNGIRISEVRYVGEKDMQCIMIDNPSHLYITDDFIVTHNTFVVLASALQLIEDGKYDEVILARSLAPLSKDDETGFLPGDLIDKLAPQFANFTSNLEALHGGKWRFKKDNENILMNAGTAIMMHKIEEGEMSIMSVANALGANLDKKILIIDEAQSLDYKALKCLVTRMKDSAKVVLLGDVEQETSSMGRPDSSALYIANKVLSKGTRTSVLSLTKNERGSACEENLALLNEFEENGGI